MKDFSIGRTEEMLGAAGLRIALVVSSYHEFVTSSLRDGAVAALEQAGVGQDNVVVIPVPGAFEIPFAARCVAQSGGFDAIVSLGCVIRGETPHFDYIASAVAHGITTASQATGVPMTFGVLTTNSREEALERVHPDETNKGWEAATAAVKLANVMERFARPSSSGSDK